MNTTTTLRFSVFLLLTCELLSTSSPSFARGGHAWYDPDEFKTVRDSHAWNGDSYMSDYDKACLYKNCKMQNVARNSPLWDGSGNGASNQGANMANYGASGENYSGPAYLGPANYSSVVQTYQWSSTPVNSSTGKIHPRAFTNGSVETAKRLGH